MFRVTPDVRYRLPLLACALSLSSVNTVPRMARKQAGLRGSLSLNKIIDLFEKDQVRHQEKAVIAIIGETFEEILGPKWWCTATR